MSMESLSYMKMISEGEISAIYSNCMLQSLLFRLHQSNLPTIIKTLSLF